jgi:hypothetical protein
MPLVRRYHQAGDLLLLIIITKKKKPKEESFREATSLKRVVNQENRLEKIMKRGDWYGKLALGNERNHP